MSTSVVDSRFMKDTEVVKVDKISFHQFQERLKKIEDWKEVFFTALVDSRFMKDTEVVKVDKISFHQFQERLRKIEDWKEVFFTAQTMGFGTGPHIEKIAGLSLMMTSSPWAQCFDLTYNLCSKYLD